MENNNLEDSLNTNTIKPLKNGGFSVEINEDFYNAMLTTDHPECEFKRGDRVKKAVYEPGDIHQIGAKGIVVGTLFEKTLGEAYLIKFDDQEHCVFTIKYKLKLYSE